MSFFRLRMPGSRLQILVRVLEDELAVTRAFNGSQRHPKCWRGKHFWGFFEEDLADPALIGRIYLARNRITAGLVAHESSHAADALARRRAMRASDVEEFRATVTGELTDLILGQAAPPSGKGKQ